MRFFSVLVIGALLIPLAPQPVQAQSDTAGTILNVIGAIANQRSNRDYYRSDPYYGGGYRSYRSSPYGYGVSSPYGYGVSSPYGYRMSSPYGYRVQSSRPYGAARIVDQGDYRNYYDAYGNYLGRERIRW